MQRKIMFVCTGNICRSAMAEAILKKKVKDKNIDKSFFVCSSGIYAYNGDVSTYEACKIMKDDFGIDLSNHRATAIRDSKIEDMDLILCMTKSHKETLNLIYPNLKNKIFLIKEYVNLEGEVKDPWGGDLVTYYDSAKELEYYIDLLLKKEGF
jgi:protein-tyrosine-phosphatase